jgi:hypothetical protein
MLPGSAATASRSSPATSFRSKRRRRLAAWRRSFIYGTANIDRIEPMSLREPDASQVAAGTGVVVGAPKHPLPQNLVNAIASVVASCGDIIEAHLPQIFVDRTMTRPAQVLVLVVADPSIAQSVLPKVVALFPAGSHLDIWPPASNNPLLVSIRRAACQICKQGLVAVEPAACTPKKKWWQVW